MGASQTSAPARGVVICPRISADRVEPGVVKRRPYLRP